MKHIKRMTALLLALALSVGLLAMTGISVSAADTITQRQQALVNTALSYYYRGKAVQYDSEVLTHQGKYEEDGANLRENDKYSPEDATTDDQKFSVCSSFCFEVYYDTLGYQITGAPLTFKTFKAAKTAANDPIVAYKVGDTDGEANREEGLKKVRETLQPGDILMAYTSEKGSGHSMLYVGDVKGDGKEYLLHCWGSKYDIELGNDKKEEDKYDDSFGGAICCTELDAIFGASTKCDAVYKLEGKDIITILRPLNVASEKDYPLTASAKGRLQFPRLDIDRKADYNRFSSVAPGKDVTVTVTLTNYSENDYTAIPVSEVIPENCTLKTGSITEGGAQSGKAIQWSVNLAKGESKTLSYAVTATGARGSVIDLSGGSVAGIRSNEIPVTIGGAELSQTVLDKLGKLDSSTDKVSGTKGTDFATAVYQNVMGLDVAIPSAKTILNDCFEKVVIGGVTLYKPKADAMNTMVIPAYFGGRTIKTDNEGYRIFTFDENRIQAGDVIVCTDSPKGGISKETVYVCYKVNSKTGTKKLAYWKNGKIASADSEILLEANLKYEFFYAVRPTLAYDDVNTLQAKPRMTFTDVTEKDWYYTYVKDLVADGTVAGIDEKTFAPKKNLTYGQALKLITLAVGEKEQAAVAGGNWASGYLKLAKEKGWLTEDVNLNGAISRLQFCRIAAKAKNLTEQPETNPFTDCADTDVLALNKAGVIAGMSENTFAPDNLLTRAQITKIIWCLRKV